ncbi:MAG: hypothetical protein H6825_09605 [Planctomycetes bacterium]|nr:hypothetical protein [Planctomycetota bacterium]
MRRQPSRHTRSATSSCLLALLALAARAPGQDFNVDYGSATPVPSTSFGGAAAQPGTWNGISGLEEFPVELVDVDGVATSVTIDADLPFGPATFDHPGTSGDLEGLLDDYLDLHSVPAAFHVHGLQAGTYVVTTYAWAPDEAAFKTAVTVNGSHTQLVGGKWPGMLRQGVTHARHEAGLADGEALDIQVFGFGKGTLNGLQLTRIETAFTDLGGGVEGESGLPELFVQGELVAHTPITFSLARAALRTPATLVLGLSRLDAPFKGGVLVPAPDVLLPLGTTNDEGTLDVSAVWPDGVPSQTAFFMQCWLPDAAAAQGFAASNAVQADVP